MTVTIVRYRAKADRADENQAFIEKVFAQLAADEPDGLRYASFRLADGVSFVHIASVETEDGSNPLSALAAFGEFQSDLGARLEEGPIVSQGTVIGSYGFPLDPPGA